VNDGITTVINKETRTGMR